MRAPYAVALVAAFGVLALMVNKDLQDFKDNVGHSSRSLRSKTAQEFDTSFDTSPVALIEEPEKEEGGLTTATICGYGEWSKYLWWVIVLYVFWAQALVCDEYFVPSIDAACERFSIPEDVAGATLMALGCNGPEMFTNIMSLFVTDSDLGVGAIIGSEIFNLLCIIGAAIIFTPESMMPLKLDPISFGRDCTFYGLSIIALFVVLKDQNVELYEAVSLVIGTVIFAIVVTLTPMFKAKYGPQAVTQTNTEANVNATASVRARTSAEDASFSPEAGVVLQVRTRPHNRMMAKAITWRTALATLKDGKITLSGNQIRHDPEGILELIEHQENITRARANTIDARAVRDRMVSGGTPLHAVNTGGSTPARVNQSFEMGAVASGPSGIIASGPSGVIGQDRNVVSRYTSAPVTFQPTNRGEKEEFSLSVKDLYHLHGDIRDRARFEVCVRPEALGVPPTIWEFKTRSAEQAEMWLQGLQKEAGAGNDIVGEELEPAHTNSKKGQVLHWFMFPVEFVFHATIPDCSNPAWRPWYPLAFFMSMVWLAFFSYLVCDVCQHIHVGFGIKEDLLGLSLAAIGSSFPNLVASVAVASQGKSDMAIANALGSNVQNVFLALGIPWTMKTIALKAAGDVPLGEGGLPSGMPSGTLFVAAKGLTEGVLFMAFTLFLLVAFVLLGKCRLARYWGVVLVIFYFIWLLTAIMQNIGDPGLLPHFIE